MKPRYKPVQPPKWYEQFPPDKTTKRLFFSPGAFHRLESVGNKDGQWWSADYEPIWRLATNNPA